jgi:hypothetical protein
MNGSGIGRSSYCAFQNLTVRKLRCFLYLSDDRDFAPDVVNRDDNDLFLSASVSL